MFHGRQHQPGSLSVDEVRPALRRVLDGAPLPADGLLLAGVIAEWDSADQRGRSFTPCPACGLRLEKVLALEHVPVCPEHPALRELRSMTEGLRTVPALFRSLAIEPPPSLGELLGSVETALRELQPVPGRVHQSVSPLLATPALRALLDSTARWADDGARERAGGRLSLLVRQWERWWHRETDPCPGCGEVVGLDELARHLADCERHPARLLLQRCRAELPEALGPAAAEEHARLLSERARYRDGLDALFRACEAYDGELGWTGERGYSDSYSEGPWRAARARGEEAAGLEETRPVGERPFGELSASWPAFAQPVAAALCRVISARPAPGQPVASPQDAALLREAGAELVALSERYGGSSSCPCCGRGTLCSLEAAEHVAGCILHPAAVRARGLEAELRVLSALALAKRPGLALRELPARPEPRLRLLPPDCNGAEPRPGPESSGPGASRELGLELEFLLDAEERANYSALVEWCGADVERTLDGWQRLRLAGECRCPACGESLEPKVLPDHLAGCPSHPEWSRAEELERRLRELRGTAETPLAALRGEADRLRIGLATLLDRCHAFWNSMGEDERGRSIIHPQLEPGWKEARAEARALLENGS